MRSVLTAAAAIAAILSTVACQRTGQQASPPAAAAQAPSVATTPGPPPTDFEQLAERLVTQSAGVKEGEIVAISGRPHDAELLEDIAVQVRKAGAFPFIEYGSDRLAKRLFFDVPERYDAQPDALALRLAEVVDVGIFLTNSTSEDLFEGADPKRVAARSKADEQVAAAYLRNDVRQIEVGNNLYPTRWRAERFGLSPDALSKLFWGGVNLDYSQLAARGEEVKAAVAAGDEVHITHPNGTDLTLRIGGRPVLVSDGIISDQDRKQGGAAVSAYLPAGEVYTTPVPGTAEGKLVHRRSWYRGKQVDNLTLTLKDGKVVGIAGSGPGYAGMKADYDAVDDARKNDFGFVDFGINPRIALPADSALGTWVSAGTVTVGTGVNTWAGGDNGVSHSFVVFLPGSTVTLDGKTVVDKGVLKL